MIHALSTPLGSLWPLELVSTTTLTGEDAGTGLLLTVGAVAALEGGVVGLAGGLVEAALCLVLLLALVDVLQHSPALVTLLQRKRTCHLKITRPLGLLIFPMRLILAKQQIRIYLYLIV